MSCEMYATGRGHAIDAVFPDRLLRGEPTHGFCLWKRYVDSVAELSGRTTAPTIVPIVEDIAYLPTSRGERRQEARRTLTRNSDGWPERLRPADHEAEVCQNYLDALSGTFRAGDCALSCNKIWTYYREVAGTKFNETTNLRLHESVGSLSLPFEDPQPGQPSCDS